jgi:hypothetical protein
MKFSNQSKWTWSRVQSMNRTALPIIIGFIVVIAILIMLEDDCKDFHSIHYYPLILNGQVDSVFHEKGSDRMVIKISSSHDNEQYFELWNGPVELEIFKYVQIGDSIFKSLNSYNVLIKRQGIATDYELKCRKEK